MDRGRIEFAQALCNRNTLILLPGLTRMDPHALAGILLFSFALGLVHAFDADHVVFSFRVDLDEKVASPQRELLLVSGRPIGVRKVDQYTVEFELAAPYSVAERIFDSVAMLPRHLLERAYNEGRLTEVWNLATPASQIAGLGPFRFREHVGGQRLVLDRNSY